MTQQFLYVEIKGGHEKEIPLGHILITKTWQQYHILELQCILVSVGHDQKLRGLMLVSNLCRQEI